VLRLLAGGHYGTTAAPAGFIYWKVTLGGTNLGDTGAITPGGAQAGARWSVDFTVRVQTVGTSATVSCHGWCRCQDGTTVMIRPFNVLSAVVDTTVERSLDLFFGWQTAHTSNSLVTNLLTVEVINPP